MSLTRTQQIEIDRILLKREALLSRIAMIESRVEALAGQAFPFVAPPDLASRQKRKKTKKKSARAKSNNQPPKIRALQDAEVCYRLVYEQDGLPSEERHTDARALQTLLAIPSSDLTVHTIQTLDAEGRIIENLIEPS